VPFCATGADRINIELVRGCSGKKAFLPSVGLFNPHFLSALSSQRTVMILPELRLLEAAIAVAQDLNFSRAAERLHIDQSAVTKRINSLESQLGFKLFERNHQSVELTEPGRRFVEEAREAVSHMERAVSSANAAFRGAEDTLNIGTTASASMR